jgi:hypothetical protein
VRDELRLPRRRRSARRGPHRDARRPPHRGGPLADGIVSDRAVICPLHERRFDLATGAPLSSQDDVVTAHAVEVRGDGVYVALSGQQRGAA